MLGLFAAGLASPATSARAQDGGAGDVSGKVTELVDSVVAAEVELEVQHRRSKILRMKQDIFRTAITDPNILEFVAFGTREVELIGVRRGTTTVTLWLGDEQNPQILSMLVRVVPDPTLEQEDRGEFADLADRINEMFPDSRIQLIPIADKLIVRGDARDEAEARQIMLVVGQASGGGGGGGGGQNQQLFQGNGQPSRLYESARIVQHDFQIVNLLHIPGAKQVMLKVRIAELSRTAGRALGAQIQNLRIGDGGADDVVTLNNLSAGSLDLSGVFRNVSFDLALQAFVSNGNAKILAEPNLVTLSGQSATFLSGGQFAVPTVVGVGGAQAATTTFKDYGTSLQFTPTVLDNDRIRLQVTPTLSSPTGVAVGDIPGLESRTVNTTVEMREGQVFAIAGLLQDQQAASIRKFPIIGDIPGLNVITADRSIDRLETELLILVTPELVEPLEPDQAPSLLPGMEVTEPNDLDFFVYGDIEGRPNAHHRSTVWPLYKNRLKRCYECDKHHKSSAFFMKGLHGFSD